MNGKYKYKCTTQSIHTHRLVVTVTNTLHIPVVGDGQPQNLRSGHGPEIGDNEKTSIETGTVRDRFKPEMNRVSARNINRDRYIP
jgi:hypothetical protein